MYKGIRRTYVCLNERQITPKIVCEILGFLNLSDFSKIFEAFSRIFKDFLGVLRLLGSWAFEISKIFEVFGDFRALA